MSVFVYVGNLASSIDEARLREAFRSANVPVRSAVIMRSSRNDVSRGFGFVELGGDEEALAAREAMDGHELEGRPLRMGEARARANPAGSRSTGSRSTGSPQGYGSESRGRRKRR